MHDRLQPAALLYPGPGAIDVEMVPPPGPITLVVVDGTWWQAKSVVRKNPALAALPRYAFRPPASSDYRIRKEPQEDYVSTVEALAHVLGVVEGDPDRFRAMLDPFRAMVDAQLSYVGTRTTPRHLPSPRREAIDPRTRIPSILRERLSDLVCVHAEANAWPYEQWGHRDSSPDELVQWTACRPATGERFEAFLAPRGGLCDRTETHLRVPRAVLLGGSDPASFLESWSRFVRPNDVIVSWGFYGTNLFRHAGGTLPSTRVDMRLVARVFACAKVGTIEAFRGHLGMTPPAPLASGRAGVRLGDLVAITRSFAT